MIAKHAAGPYALRMTVLNAVFHVQTTPNLTQATYKKKNEIGPTLFLSKKSRFFYSFERSKYTGEHLSRKTTTTTAAWISFRLLVFLHCLLIFTKNLGSL